jgi:elongation factor P
MDTTTYEQITLSDEMIGENKEYILPNSTVRVDFYDSKPVGIELPLTVVLKVVDTEPFVKRATASAQLKPATLETGLKVTVPGFVNIDDLVKVNTETGEYVSRANSYDE